MNAPLPPELQELHAYVDHQLSPEAVRRVEDRLAGDEAASRQARDYQLLREGLKKLYDPVAAEPVPRKLERRRRWRRPRAAMAAGVMLFVAGSWTGWVLHDAVPAAVAETNYVVREAAMAYTVYSPEVRHPVEVYADQEQHLISWLTKRIGSPVKAPRLGELGYRLVGGRLLATEEGPGALFMYEDNAGTRVVLYLCVNDEGENTAFRYAEHEKVNVFWWREGPLSYAIAGKLKREDMMRLTERVYHEINT